MAQNGVFYCFLIIPLPVEPILSGQLVSSTIPHGWLLSASLTVVTGYLSQLQFEENH